MMGQAFSGGRSKDLQILGVFIIFRLLRPEGEESKERNRRGKSGYSQPGQLILCILDAADMKIMLLRTG
jgi:hypothetical protein